MLSSRGTVRSAVWLSLPSALLFGGAPAGGAAEEAAGYVIGQTTVPEVLIHKDPARFGVHPRHPRLFFRDTDLPTIRRRISSTHTEDWDWLTSLADRMLARDPSPWAKKPKGWGPTRTVAFVAAVTGEKRYRDWATRWADLMVKIGPEEGPDDNYRGRLMGLAIIYDWFFDRLSEAQRRRYGDSIVAHIDRNWYFAERPMFSGGHSRWGNFSLAAGLLAVVTERPELRERLLQVRRNWLEGYHPLQGWVAVDGGYHMAWTYGAAYNMVRNHCVWSSATNESVYYPWRGLLPYFWLYGRQGDGGYALSGDAYSRGAPDWSTLVTAAGVLKNRHAAWFMRDLLARSSHLDRFWTALFEDTSVRPLAPDDPADPLPLSRHFRNAGYVLFRDRWDEQVTLFSFKCSSFMTVNHHHRDHNAFTLNYRGRLAIDSGSYQKGSRYGSVHWHNYFTRTIAHNSVTAFDPAESFGSSRSGPRSNDGGQKSIREPKTLTELLPGTPASLDGITGYADEGDYAFARGDATKAYSAHKLTRFVRTVVYLRRPAGRAQPVVIIHDEVVATRPDFVKRFLLHSVREPKVSDGRVEITEGAGRLHAITVLPRGAKIETVGGPGKQFWVNGRNYGLEGLTGGKLREALEWAGEWRVEISPPRPAAADRFLHVLAPEAADSKSPPPECEPVEGGALTGVVVCGHAALFVPQGGAAASVRYQLPGRGATTHIIVGITPSVPLVLSAGGVRVAAATSTPGGSVRFRVPAGARGPFTIRRRTATLPAARQELRRRREAQQSFR